MCLVSFSHCSVFRTRLHFSVYLLFVSFLWLNYLYIDKLYLIYPIISSWASGIFVFGFWNCVARNICLQFGFFCFCFLNVHILFSWSETLVRSEIARAYDSSVSLLWKCLYSLLTSKVAIEVLEAFLVSDPANVTFVLLLPRSSRIIPLSPRLWNFIMMSLAVAVFTQCSGCLLGHFNCEIQVLAS